MAVEEEDDGVEDIRCNICGGCPICGAYCRAFGCACDEQQESSE